MLYTIATITSTTRAVVRSARVNSFHSFNVVINTFHNCNAASQRDMTTMDTTAPSSAKTDAEDALYVYDADAQRAAVAAKPWARNPHHFKKYVPTRSAGHRASRAQHVFNARQRRTRRKRHRDGAVDIARACHH